MRAVVKVKSMGGKGASRVARYIAESKLDPVREGKRRALFSDREDDLAVGGDRTYRKADQYLSGGRGAPRKCDLIHFSVSFREEDFERLGSGDDERKGRLREAAREAMAEVQADLNVAGWRWIAGIHLNTPHPHVHIVIHKEVTDRKTALPRRLGNLPKRCCRTANAGLTAQSGQWTEASPGISSRRWNWRRSGRERLNAQRGEGYGSHDRTEYTKSPRPDGFDRLLEAASHNPSLAGRDLTMEIIARGPEPEPGERLNPADDIRDALTEQKSRRQRLSDADRAGRRVG